MSPRKYGRSGAGTRVHVAPNAGAMSYCGCSLTITFSPEHEVDPEMVCGSCLSIARQGGVDVAPDPPRQISRSPEPACERSEESDLGWLLKGVLAVAAIIMVAAILGDYALLVAIALGLWFMGTTGREYLVFLCVIFGLPTIIAALGYPGLAEAFFVLFGLMLFITAFSGGRGSWAGSDRGAFDDSDGM